MYEMRRAEGRDDWSEVRELRYRALLSRGEIAEDPEGFPDDGHDSALNTVTFLLTRQGRTLGTTRSSVSSSARRWPLPSIEAFHNELEAAIGWEATIVESSLTVIDPAFAGEPRDLFFRLLKAQLVRCAVESADWLVAAVPESQIGFHRRMFNMEILSGSERYPRVRRPRVLMGLEYPRQAPILAKRIPTLAVSAADERAFQLTGRIEFPPAQPARYVA